MLNWARDKLDASMSVALCNRFDQLGPGDKFVEFAQNTDTR